jgi:hypothetical protein
MGENINVILGCLYCREHDKKVCILGLASLLLVPTEAMPHELQSGLNEVFKAVLKLLVAYKEQRTEASKGLEDGENEDEDLDGWGSGDDDDWDKEIADDEDEGDEAADSQKLQRLAAHVRS